MLLLIIVNLFLLPTWLSPIYNLSWLEVSWRWSNAWLLLVGRLDGQAAAQTGLLLMRGGRLLLLDGQAAAQTGLLLLVGGGRLLLGRAAAGCCLMLLLLLGGGLLLRAAASPLLAPATWRRNPFQELGLDVPLGERCCNIFGAHGKDISCYLQSCSSWSCGNFDKREDPIFSK